MFRQEYVLRMAAIAAYTDEDWWQGRVPEGTPSLYSLTEQFLEEGGTAWGFLPFEVRLSDILESWAESGKLVKVRLFCEYWLNSVEDSSMQEFLKRWASGNYLQFLNKKACSFPGHPDRYLYPFNLPMYLEALEVKGDRDLEMRASVNAAVFVATGKTLT